MVAELKSLLPDDVAQMVATLREMCWDECDSAADMIERLARQVPEGCVVVPREPTEAMIDAPRGFTQIIRGMNGCTFAQARAHCVNRGDNMLLWPEWARNEQGYVTEAAAALFVYQLMIAAGEVKP